MAKPIRNGLLSSLDYIQKYIWLKDQRVYELKIAQDRLKKILDEKYKMTIAYNGKISIRNIYSFLSRSGYSNMTRSYISTQNGQIKIETYYNNLFFLLFIIIFVNLLGLVYVSFVFVIIAIILFAAFKVSLIKRRIELINFLKKNLH